MIKVLYAGSPEASAKTLEYLIDNSTQNGFEIVGVLTNPPTAKGRHKELIPTPVALMAKQKGIREDFIYSFEHLDQNAREQVIKSNADILVCFAYGHIFGPKFLSMFKYGGINLHPSLLPKYRGCTPVNAAILNRDETTAITIQTVSLKMDEGDILSQKIINLNFTETATSLLETSALEGAKLITQILSKINTENVLPIGTKQIGEASYTSIIKKGDAKIDFSQSVNSIDATVRAYYLEPGAFCFDSNNNSIKILSCVPCTFENIKSLNSSVTQEEIEEYINLPCGKVLKFDKPTGIWVKAADGIICIKSLQKQGKNVMSYKDFINGSRDFVGSVLT